MRVPVFLLVICNFHITNIKNILTMIRIFIPLFSLLLLFVNCDCSKSVNNDNLTPQLGDNYTIILINDLNVESEGLTMNFDKSTNNVSGNAGCNEYFSNFEQNNKNILFSKVGATKKYCQDSQIRDIEKQLLTLLPNIKLMDSKKPGKIDFYNDQSLLIMSISISD